jgi:hypothetical protein
MDCNTWYKSSFSVSRAYVSEDYNNGILYQIWVVYICLNIFVFEYFYLWSFWSIFRSFLTWMSDVNFYWIKLSYLHFRFIWCLFNFFFYLNYIYIHYIGEAVQKFNIDFILFMLRQQFLLVTMCSPYSLNMLFSPLVFLFFCTIEAAIKLL